MRLSLPYLAFVLVLIVGFVLLGNRGEDTKPPEPTAPQTDTALTAAQVVAAFDTPPPNRVPSEKTNNTGEPWGDYVGSDACARCHQEEYAKWKLSFHSKTLYDADQHSIFGDFASQYDAAYNERRSAHDDPLMQRQRRAFTIRTFTKVDKVTSNTRYFMDIKWRSVADGGLPEEMRELANTWGNATGIPEIGIGPVEIIYAFGNRKHQPYIAKWPDDTHWVLPIYWNDVEDKWLFAGFRTYTDGCGNCHVTGIRHSRTGTRKIPMTGREGSGRPLLYLTEKEQWADGAVGCENCHGPGKDHVRAVERTGSEKYAALIKSGDADPTIWDAKRGKFHLAQDNCGRCHNYFTESACAWLPTPDGYTREPSVWSMRGDKFQKYADGSERSPCVLVDTYRTSKMHAHEVACSDCHDPHGNSNWADLTDSIEDNSLCLKCHQEYATVEEQTKHSFHKAGTYGNRCVECHMPRHLAFANGEQLMSKQVNSHAFSVPTGRRRKGGPPSACNICHKDRDHAWTRSILKDWWGPDVDTTTPLPIMTVNGTKGPR